MNADSETQLLSYCATDLVHNVQSTLKLFVPTYRCRAKNRLKTNYIFTYVLSARKFFFFKQPRQDISSY